MPASLLLPLPCLTHHALVHLIFDLNLTKAGTSLRTRVRVADELF